MAKNCKPDNFDGRCCWCGSEKPLDVCPRRLSSLGWGQRIKCKLGYHNYLPPFSKHNIWSWMSCRECGFHTPDWGMAWRLPWIKED